MASAAVIVHVAAITSGLPVSNCTLTSLLNALSRLETINRRDFEVISHAVGESIYPLHSVCYGCRSGID